MSNPTPQRSNTKRLKRKKERKILKGLTSLEQTMRKMMIERKVKQREERSRKGNK